MSILNTGPEGKQSSYLSANHYQSSKYKLPRKEGKCNTKSLENWTLYIYVAVLPFKWSPQPVQGQSPLFTMERLLISYHLHIQRASLLPNQS